jgi:hypothetical protein
MEDAEDLAAMEAVDCEPTLSFEDFVRDPQARGKL